MVDDGTFGPETLRIRAVLQVGDEDVSAALMQAGIFDPVTVPVAVGAEPDISQGLLGDGATDNVVGVLSWDDAQGRDDDTVPAPQQRNAEQEGAAASAATRMLPAAFGRRPMAPVGAGGAPATLRAGIAASPLPATGDARSEH